MTEVAKSRFNKVLMGLYLSSALAIALLVGLRGHDEGQGWVSCILMGAMAGVLISYAVFFVAIRGIGALRRVSRRTQRIQSARSSVARRR